MDVREIFRLQDNAGAANLAELPAEFAWCQRGIPLGYEIHTLLGTDAAIAGHRRRQRDEALAEHQGMNVVVNLSYDALGSLTVAVRLVQVGVLADAWSLIRVAFESCCYADYFSCSPADVQRFVDLGEEVRADLTLNIGDRLRHHGLAFTRIRRALEARDAQSREAFFARLCNFGAHASPVRCGLRMRVGEPEVRAYLSINHRALHQCVADLAAVLKYAVGIPLEAYPRLFEDRHELLERWRRWEEAYASSF